MITEPRPRGSLPRIAATADISAPADDLYRLIADYRFGHQRILPPAFFRNLQLERGGFGAGTVIAFDLLAFGRRQRQRAFITEPAPGSELVETYPDNGAVTTFTVEPLGPRRSRVTITTTFRVRPGVIGLIELLVTRRFLRRVFVAELALIGDEARNARRKAGRKTLAWWAAR